MQAMINLRAAQASYRKKIESTNGSRLALGRSLARILTTILPRTTERPGRESGDECSELPRREAPQSHGRKSMVRGLQKSMNDG